MGDFEYILWTDLETTGLDKQRDFICEAAFVLTDVEYNEYFTITQVLSIPGEGYKRIYASPVVHEMHVLSGLLDEMTLSPLTVTDLDELVAEEIAVAVPEEHRGKVRIGGSGVSHFDLDFVAKWLPSVRSWLDWRPLDVGQVEEWFALWGLPTYDEARPDEKGRKTHRALDDILFHIDEAKFYDEQIKALHSHSSPL